MRLITGDRNDVISKWQIDVNRKAAKFFSLSGWEQSLIRLWGSITDIKVTIAKRFLLWDSATSTQLPHVYRENWEFIFKN